MLCDLCGSVALTGNVCTWCGMKASYERLQQAAAVNLQTSTVADMIGRFVIENHQAKHYAGGDRAYAHFDSKNGQLNWQQVHKLIVYCVQQILTSQKARGLIKPADGYVQFARLAGGDEWYAGRNKGYTNVVMVQLTIGLQDGFSGHGYPLDQKRIAALGRDPNIVDGTFADSVDIELSGVNNTIRILRHGT